MKMYNIRIHHRNFFSLFLLFFTHLMSASFKLLPRLYTFNVHCEAFPADATQNVFNGKNFLTASCVCLCVCGSHTKSTTICFLNPYKIYRENYILKEIWWWWRMCVVSMCGCICSLETKEPLHFCLPSHFILVSLNLPRCKLQRVLNFRLVKRMHIHHIKLFCVLFCNECATIEYVCTVCV